MSDIFDDQFLASYFPELARIDEASLPLSEGAPPAVADLLQQISMLSARVDDVETARQSLEGELQASLKVAQQYREIAEEARQREEDANNRILDLEDELKRQVDAADSVTDERLTQVVRMLDESRSENDELRSQVTSLRGHLSEAAHDFTELQERLRDAQESRDDALRQMRRLQDQLAAARADADYMSERCRCLESELAAQTRYQRHSPPQLPQQNQQSPVPAVQQFQTVAPQPVQRSRPPASPRGVQQARPAPMPSTQPPMPEPQFSQGPTMASELDSHSLQQLSTAELQRLQREIAERRVAVDQRIAAGGMAMPSTANDKQTQGSPVSVTIPALDESRLGSMTLSELNDILTARNILLDQLTTELNKLRGKNRPGLQLQRDRLEQQLRELQNQVSSVRRHLRKSNLQINSDEPQARRSRRAEQSQPVRL